MGCKWKEITYSNGNQYVQVKVLVNDSDLTNDETRWAVDGLTNKVMLALSEAKYINAPLCRQKVRSPRHG